MTESPSGKIIYTENDGLFVLALNHPEDIIDIEVMQDLITILSTEIDTGRHRALILRGRSSMAFSMGYDGSCQKLDDKEFVKKTQQTWPYNINDSEVT